jgi:LuxR family maltose regulon positive regulatory protein
MEAQRITWLRLLVHSGRHGEARAALQAEIRGATVKHRVRRLVRLKLLLAICLDAEGNQMLARRTLIEALGLAAPGGMIRTIVDEGPAAMRLVGDLRAEGLASGVKWGNDPVAALVEALLAAESGAAGASEEAPVEAPLEPLTQRERDLLYFLALGYSNSDLSDRLAVSENTVKFHLRNIYAKLGVSSRMQAVQAARHYRLVD